jgi:hypothetical protein
VKYDKTQLFDTSLENFERALFDAHVYARLEQGMPSVKKIVELERQDDGNTLRRRVHYIPANEVPAFARGSIKPEHLEWIEESTYDRGRKSCEYIIKANIPERWSDRFKSRGGWTLREEGGKVKRVIEGEVTIKVSLVGGMAERYVVNQVKRNLDEEAEVLKNLLRG